MKKLLILTATLLTGGLALPASAQSRQHHRQTNEVFISGYRSCGTPIYSKRVRNGRYFYNQPLSSCELRTYLERQSRIQAQLELERRIARERYIRSRYLPRNQRRCR